MSDDDLCYRSATEMASLLRAGTISSVELVDAHLDRIARHDEALGAFITVFAEEARTAARAADVALRAGSDDRALLGVPVAIKDEAGAAGHPGTFGLLALRDRIVARDATHTARLRAAGAIVLGATSLPELGHRATTINRLRGVTSTPFDLGMNAGGSSGGSAAAVAAGMAPFAHGSDGGGSVRIPAAMCGVVGLVGTYGRVPRVTRPDAYNGRGNFPFDGVLARTVGDAVLMLRLIAGHDPRDPFSLPGPVPSWSSRPAPAAGLRVGWTPDLSGAFAVEPEVAGAVRDAVEALRATGVDVGDADLDTGLDGDELNDVTTRYLSSALAGAAAAMREDGVDLVGAVREEVDPQVLAHIEAGDRMTVVQAKLDDLIRTRVLDTFATAFERCDVLVSPTVAVAGVSNDDARGPGGPTSVAGRPVEPLLGWVLTAPVNFCGYPAMSVPAGRAGGLPIGLQIVAPHGREDLCLRVAAAIEEVRPWHGSYADARRALDAAALEGARS